MTAPAPVDAAVLAALDEVRACEEKHVDDLADQARLEGARFARSAAEHRRHGRAERAEWAAKRAAAYSAVAALVRAARTTGEAR